MLGKCKVNVLWRFDGGGRDREIGKYMQIEPAELM